MKTIIKRVFGGDQINIHIVTFWLTLIFSILFFAYVFLVKMP